MKRHLTPEGSEELRSKSRRILDSRSRAEEEDPGGYLDLNTTPRGFDLNAPVADEDSSHGQSGWLPQDQFEGKGNTAESKPSVVKEVAQPQSSFKDENDDVASKPENPGSDILSSATVGLAQERETEEEGIDPKESYNEPEVKPVIVQSVKPAVPRTIIQRTLEPLSVLRIDEDLDILRSIWSAHQQNDLEILDSIVVEACEELVKSPSNPSRYHYLSCMYISKKLPEVFGLPKTFKVLMGFFQSHTGSQSTVKRQIILPVLASKLLLRAFAAEPEWPLEFVQIYLEDATTTRSWIEHEGCKEFVANILTAFPDVDVDASEDSTIGRLQDGQGGSGEITQGQVVKNDAATSQSQGMLPSKNRYPSEEVRAKVRTEFLQALNQLLASASTKDNPRPLLKLLLQGAGYEEVRVVASSMLESYLNNPVHLRAAKALLDRILQHTRGTSENDLNTVGNLLALRITSMQPSAQTKSLHGNIFGDMLTQLVRRKPEYSTLALKTFVTAEVNNRNLHNLKSIVMVLKAMPESPPPEYELALILQELAANEDYRLHLRDFVRRMMKQVGTEIDVHHLCHGLMQPWPAMGEQHEILKEAWLKQLVDLSCQLLLLATVPFALDENVVSAITSSSASSSCGAGITSLKEKLLQLEKFSLDTANFQVEAVAWCTDVLAIYLPSMDENQFTCFVRQILFLESSEVYYNMTENVSEVDLVSLRLLSSCLPAPEEILARLILMAISNYPVSQGEALKLIERLVWRAASLKKHFHGALIAASEQLPAAIFKLASFNLPGVTRQPVAQLVVKDMYWRACLVVLIIAAYNPSTIGWFVWENLPTVRCLMEALLTCTRTFLPVSVDDLRLSEAEKLELEAEQRDIKAEEAISAFLDVTEKRRNDPSSMDIDSRGTSTLARSTSQGGEWKGKVMFLNPAGPVRRPPKSMVDELNRVDEKYQLGHFLRKSRNPDFFAEITKLQTLPQAWPWLQKILVQAPESITYLPPIWQGELLFMHEGQHPLVHGLALDIEKLRAHLHQVMVQQVQSKEGDIESVVDFLSHKLLSKSSSFRVRARRCFSCLFDVPPSCGPDFNGSVPSSPQDSKRMDFSGGATAGVILPVKGAISSDSIVGPVKKVIGVSTTTTTTSNIGASAVQVPSATLSALPGAILRSSPGVSQVSLVKDGTQDRIAPGTRVSIPGDDCGWLGNLERVATASRVVSVLAPIIQRAIHHENAIFVVKAYLEFLQKHMSRTSLACCIATFVVNRKMVASGLLLGPAKSFGTNEDAADSGPVSPAATIDLVLESLSSALESGTVDNQNWDAVASIESPVVTLVLPQTCANTGSLRVQVHQIVVDAAMEILCLLGQEDIEDTRMKLRFEHLLNLLFPAVDDVKSISERDANVPIGWLEDESGKRPLVSEPRAVSFVRSKNTWLVKIGLSHLSLESKLELLENFGYSSAGAEALFTDLNPSENARLEMVLGSGRFVGQRLNKLCSCLRAMVKAGNIGGANLLRVLEQFTSRVSVGQSQMQSFTPESRQENPEDLLIKPTEATSWQEPVNQSIEEITRDAFRWFTTPKIGAHIGWERCLGKPVHCIQLRQYLQTVLIGGWNQRISNCVDIMFNILEKADGGSLADSKFLSFGLPILALLSQHTSVMDGSNSELPVSTPRYTNMYFNHGGRLSTEQDLLDWELQSRCSGDSEVSRLLTAATLLVRTMQKKLMYLCSISTATNKEGILQTAKAADMVAVKMRGSARVSKHIDACEKLYSGVDFSFSVVERASVDRFETVLCYFLFQKLKVIWDEISRCSVSSIPGSLPISTISKYLVDLLRRWMLKDGTVGSAAPSDSTLFVAGDQVEYSGRCGFVMEILGLLDPEFCSDGLLNFLLDMSQQSSPLSGSFILSGFLVSVVHKSSWKTLTNVLHLLLGMDMDIINSPPLKSGLLDPGDRGHTSGSPSFVFRGMEGVMEFIAVCVQHPRSRLACRMSDEGFMQKLSSKLTWSWLDPPSARVLTKHAVSACTLAKLRNDVESVNVTKSNEWIRQYLHELEQKTLGPQNRCLKVLMQAASQGPHIMHAIVRQLCSYEDLGSEFICTILETSVRNTVKVAAQNFLQGLYLAFPVSIKMILVSLETKLHLPDKTEGFSDIGSIQGQTCSLNNIVHGALRSICDGNEKDSTAAYGFCQEFSRNHPLLVIPHLSTLRLLLKELLPQLKQGDPVARATVIRALSMGLGLLDALRPHVISINNASGYKMSARTFRPCNSCIDKSGKSLPPFKDGDCRKQKTDLEEMLDLYFQILRDLDVQDRAHLAKVVARLSDFLCHCVAAGGRSREYVAAHRTPILETTAQTFSKLKKIGFLLSLLDKPEVTSHVEETSASSVVVSRPLNSVSRPPPAASSSVALDDILKVRAQLQHCIKLHTGESWQEQGLVFYSPGRSLQVSLMSGNWERGILSATLNDLERASARMPAILTILEDSLVQLTMVKDAPVRDQIYNLLERSLLHSPSEESISNIVEGLLQQLRSSDVLRAKSAARNASRFFHFSPELQESILVEMLQLGRIAADDLQQLLQSLFSVAGCPIPQCTKNL